mmetsp:Transcript_29294/g.5288  ORF Transcript_29294/g.5288 Transcript_29294/m.5288 type:complete len:86 (+) Transcript_29294:96-353(+)
MKDSTSCYTSMESPSRCKRLFSPMGPGSLRGSVFTLCSCLIGVGVLSLPYTLAQCGIVLGLGLMLACAGIYLVFYYITIQAMTEL